MKITMDAASIAEYEKAQNCRVKVGPAMPGKDYGVQLGHSEIGPGTYEGAVHSFEDFKDTLSATDVDVMQDRMTVLSAMVSTEDFNEIMKDGSVADCLKPEEVVTIMDHIKLALIKGGTQIEGFTDNISKEALTAMTGSEGFSGRLLKEAGLNDDVLCTQLNAFDASIDADCAKEILDAYTMSKELTDIGDSSKRFLVASSNRPLSIENLYLAKHSTKDSASGSGAAYFSLETPGYIAKKADLLPISDNEITKLLSDMGVESTESVVNDTRWLIENSLYVNEDNLHRIADINSIKLPVTDYEFARAVAISISEGHSPKEAVLNKTQNKYMLASEATDRIDKEISNELLKLTDGTEGSVEARKILERVRIKMTAAANLKLMESNITLDISDAEHYLELLEGISQSEEGSIPNELIAVKDTIGAVRNAPVSLVGYMACNIKTVTLENLKEEGIGIAARIDIASEYEKVGTKVRTDLGDSIKKAFRNVDDILLDLNITPDASYRRAVRILGYNSMPVNKESIEEIRNADEMLQRVLDRLTPRDTVNLIRMGMSPLSMSVAKLDEYLGNKPSEEIGEMDKYSKFLYKLEKNNDITKEEREEYIDVYRLLYRLNKDDYSYVGSVINAGLDMTFSNLKNAVEIKKNKSMDVHIDKDFGFLCSNLRKVLEPERMKAVGVDNSVLLNEVYDEMEKIPIDYKLEYEYTKECLKKFKEAMNSPKEVVSELMCSGQIVCEDTLEGCSNLLKRRNSLFNSHNEAFIGKIRDFSNKIVDNFNDEGVKADLNELNEQIREETFNEAMNEDNYIDLKERKLIYKSVSLSFSMADSENYNIPMEIGGVMTAVNVKIVHGAKEQRGVVCSFENEELGRISARFVGDESDIEGVILCNLPETVSKMQKVADILGTKVKVIRSFESNESLSRVPLKDNSDETDSSAYYRMAKRFLQSLGKLG